MINPNYFWIVIFFLSIGTFLLRFSLIALSSRVTISDRTKEILSYIPAAVLPAFIAPAVYFHKGQVDWIFGKERILALAFATIILLLTRSILLTIVSGLLILYLVSQFLY